MMGLSVGASQNRERPGCCFVSRMFKDVVYERGSRKWPQICWFHTDLQDILYVYEGTKTHNGLVLNRDGQYTVLYYLKREPESISK